MATSLRTALVVALVTVCSAGCHRNPGQPGASEKLVSACGCDLFKLSTDQIRTLTNKARSGDLSAAKELWDHYSWYGDDENAAVWEELLFKAGEPEAIDHRTDELFHEAYHLADTDPMKLALLKRTVVVEARYRRITTGRVLHVMINGKIVDIRQSGEPDEFTKNIHDTLTRVEAAQGKR